jgi:hypothetical protein
LRASRKRLYKLAGTTSDQQGTEQEENSQG